MGQLCSRPRTVEDKHHTEPEPEGVRVNAESGHWQHATPHSHDLHSEVNQHALLENQGSDAELSELDVVVQQLRNNQNSVTGSAPQLLQQWDHDHRIVLESIDASIQVYACSLPKLNFPCCVCEPLLWGCAEGAASEPQGRKWQPNHPWAPSHTICLLAHRLNSAKQQVGQCNAIWFAAYTAPHSASSASLTSGASAHSSQAGLCR